MVTADTKDSAPDFGPDFGQPDFGQLFASLPGRYLVVTPELRIVAATDAYLRALKTRREAIVGRALFDAFPDNPGEAGARYADNVRASLKRVLTQGVAESLPVQKYDLQRPPEEGGAYEEHYWSLTSSPVLDRDGIVRFIILSVEDVTEFSKLRKQGAEQSRLTEDLQLRADRMEMEIFERAQQLEDMNLRLRVTNQELEQLNRARMEFFANMSHELRTPLNAVVGMTGLLLDTNLDRQQRELAQTARDSSEMLLQLINDILDYSKVEAGRLELEEHPFEIRSCIEESLDLVAAGAAEKGLELTYWCDPLLPSCVSGDVARFRQVIVNLLSNAVKFTPRGEVVAELSGRPLPDDEFELEVAVRDTGIGIPADRMDRLFQPYRQADAATNRQFGGTGLGLAICKRLVEAMEGRIAVRSQPGTGSTFRFTVKAGLVTEVQSPFREMPPGVAALQGQRVLVVDDNETNRRVLRLQCESCGMIVTETGSPLQALKLMRGGQPFDIALLDHLMPEMDGLTLAHEIRKLHDAEDLKLVIMTSAGLPQRAARDANISVQGIWTKPLRQSMLVETLAQLLSPHSDIASRRRDDITSNVAMFARPMRILIAEDNPANQRVVVLMLDKLGQKADTVATGLEAVCAVKERRYDLVLMDVLMPEMDGIEATRTIRAQLSPERQPCIVAMTANALSGDREHCLQAGMDDYISKPVRLEMLAEMLARWSPSATGRTAGTARSAKSAGTAPLYDTQTLDRWASALGSEVMVNVLRVMIGDAPRLMQGLRSALDRFEPGQLKFFAHSLRSNALMVGAAELGQRAQELETLGASGSMGTPIQIYSLLEDYERLMQAMASICEQHTPRGSA